MKPKKPQQDQADLFHSRLDQILDRQHPLFVLANQIDWSVDPIPISWCLLDVA
jgi:IS5 family transposase